VALLLELTLLLIPSIVKGEATSYPRGQAVCEAGQIGKIVLRGQSEPRTGAFLNALKSCANRYGLSGGAVPYMPGRWIVISERWLCHT
jgi:hypothetical protein